MADRYDIVWSPSSQSYVVQHEDLRLKLGAQCGWLFWERRGEATTATAFQLALNWPPSQAPMVLMANYEGYGTAVRKICYFPKYGPYQSLEKDWRARVKL